jgi:hypothetical protein
MSQAGTTEDTPFEEIDYRPWLEMLRRPVAVAVGAAAILLLVIVAASKPAWDLLGAGRGFVPEELYPASGFLLVLGTTLGQVVGWAMGVAIAVYAVHLAGFPPTWNTVRLAMAVVYLGLVVLPLLVFHFLFGGWLLGLPHAGISAWLADHHPFARWLLIDAHPVIDLSMIPLAAIFLGILWQYAERVQRESTLQTVLALALVGTSLAVALSLAIHSILVHIHMV